MDFHKSQNNILSSARVFVEFMGESVDFVLSTDANLITLNTDIAYKNYLIALLEDAADYIRAKS